VHNFLALFMKNTAFPAPARKFLADLLENVNADIKPILDRFEENYDHEEILPLVEDLAKNAGVSPYSIWMLVLILAAEKARTVFETEKQYWDTFCDLRYKAQECFDLHGIWGSFVPHWYPRFYRGNIVKLGRMEYETRTGALKDTYSLFGITLGPTDTTIHLHIPSSAEPFDEAARLDSYKQAFAHFCKDGQPLVCICGSWLLYEGYESIFAKGSNIGTFRKEFHLLKHKQTDSFGDGWRVFGKAYQDDPKSLPEDTSLRRAFKHYILNGGQFGTGTGVLVFDGKNILTGQ